MPVQMEVKETLYKLLDRDYSENTRQAIWNDVKNFLAWYLSVNKEMFTFQGVTERDIREYREWAQREKLSASTINRRLVTLGQFFKQARADDLIAKNPAEDVAQLPKQSLAPKGLSQPEVRRLLREVEARGTLRDRCIIELMIGAGLRVSDVVSISVSDVQISERKGHLLIRKGKGNKTRSVPLNTELRRLLTEYIKTEQPKDHLFMGQRGELGAIAINKIVEKYAEKAGVDASPHSLRHTFAYNFLKQHPSELVPLSQILGHTSINTTAIYTQQRLEDLQDKVEKMVY